jgi:transposase-like protein
MSRHRFNHSVDYSDDTKVVTATARPRRIEVITGVERRGKWSAQEKAAIVAESLAEGAIVSEVARRWERRFDAGTMPTRHVSQFSVKYSSGQKRLDMPNVLVSQSFEILQRQPR